MRGPAARKARIFAGAILGLLGLAAGSISYAHMHQLAMTYGETGWSAHVFPLTVDGVEIVASVLLFVSHLAGRQPRKLVWPTMIVSTFISVGANVLVAAGNGVVGCAVAGWPPLALLLAIKLLLGLLEDYPFEDLAELHSANDEDGAAGEGSASPRASLLPATSAARIRWLRVWESICEQDGTDREVADRLGVSERQIRLVRAAGRAGEFNDFADEPPNAVWAAEGRSDADIDRFGRTHFRRSLSVLRR